MRAFLCVAVLVVGTGAVAKECRMPDLPPGARVAIPPECRDVVRARESGSAGARLKAQQGFIDLGGGTSVLIGGRVRAEMGVRR